MQLKIMNSNNLNTSFYILLHKITLKFQKEGRLQEKIISSLYILKK